jgi:hypothetical protein
MIGDNLIRKYMKDAKCEFCKSNVKAKEVENTANFYSFDCKICGLYFISYGAFEKIKKRKIK